MATAAFVPIGSLLREWRQRRHLSQLDLATTAGVSQRHLSFLESGRAMPSREMVLRLSRHLDVPPRERNALLVAAGFAPVHRERPLGDPMLAAAREAVEQVLQRYEPFPALAVDRHWMLQMANRALAPLLDGIHADLLQPPVNVLRLSLHPLGLAPRIVNLHAWREHVFWRLERQVRASGDETLGALLRELRELPEPPQPHPARTPGPDLAGIAVPLQIATARGVLSFLSTTTVFGTPVDITLAELAIEAFLPADAETARALSDAQR